MTLLIKNGGYWMVKIGFNVFYVIRKQVQLLQILSNLSIRHLIKLILYENDVKLSKFKRSPYRLICDMSEV